MRIKKSLDILRCNVYEGLLRGSDYFIANLSKITGRDLRFEKVGRAKKRQRPLVPKLLYEKNRKHTMKEEFESQLKEFVEGLEEHISTEDGQWTVKGFIDVFQNIYTISSDTKIVSKILEIHLFPKIMEFARKYGYKIVLAEHQNYYPDISFVNAEDESIKFAVDFKTTYRNPKKPYLCNGFTLGSHGKYFEDRVSTKNIQFPYGEYSGHFCLGIIYDRADSASIDETACHNIKDLHSIASVVSGF